MGISTWTFLLMELGSMSTCTILACGANSESLPVTGHRNGLHRNEDVGLGDRHVGAVSAVHPQHAHPQGVVPGEAAQSP